MVGNARAPRAAPGTTKGAFAHMGAHSKRRTRGRTAAVGALTAGASLTGVGLTAAALDPGAVVFADGVITGLTTGYDAGLGAPVAVGIGTTAVTIPAASTIGGGTGSHRRPDGVAPASAMTVTQSDGTSGSAGNRPPTLRGSGGTVTLPTSTQVGRHAGPGSGSSAPGAPTAGAPGAPTAGAPGAPPAAPKHASAGPGSSASGLPALPVSLTSLRSLPTAAKASSIATTLLGQVEANPVGAVTAAVRQVESDPGGSARTLLGNVTGLA
jgi:hypothetical protein